MTLRPFSSSRPRPSSRPTAWDAGDVCRLKLNASLPRPSEGRDVSPGQTPDATNRVPTASLRGTRVPSRDAAPHMGGRFFHDQGHNPGGVCKTDIGSSFGRMLIAPHGDRPGVRIHHMVKKIVKRPGRSAARADWKFLGAEVPPAVYDATQAEAGDNGVPQAVVIRWALESYLHDRLEAAK